MGLSNTKTLRRFLKIIVLGFLVIVVLLLINYKKRQFLIKVQADVTQQTIVKNTLTTTENYRANARNIAAKETQRYNKQKAIVIFSGFRTGSTFLGEFFNQNPGVYYLFEPLHVDEKLQKILLKDLLRCDYSRVPEIYKSRGNESDRYLRCKYNICFPWLSNFLWRNTNLCVNKQPYCGSYALDTNVLEKVCTQSLATVVKLVKLNHLSELEHILLDPDLDVKVIHLVRDPRPAVPSRLKMSDMTNKKSSKAGNLDSKRYEISAEYLCRFYERNILYAKNCIDGKYRTSIAEKVSYSCNNTISKAWQQRYMRISHEYISENPLDSLRQIYNYVGINFDRNVEEWVSRHTANTTDKIEKKNSADKFFGTSRNSMKTLNAWRLKEQFVNVEIIQKSCSYAMESLGYIKAENEIHLQNISCSLYDIKQGLYRG